MPTSAMKDFFQIAECSLSYAKIMPASAMKDFFQIAECSLSYAKLSIISECRQHSAFKSMLLCVWWQIAWSMWGVCG
jgi:hypothetical protein